MFKTMNELQKAIAKSIGNGCEQSDVAEEMQNRRYVVNRSSREDKLHIDALEVARLRNRLLPHLEARRNDLAAEAAHRAYDRGDWGPTAKSTRNTTAMALSSFGGPTVPKVYSNHAVGLTRSERMERLLDSMADDAVRYARTKR